MKTEQILMCVVALVLGMLLANMLKSVCGCKNLIEGQETQSCNNLNYYTQPSDGIGHSEGAFSCSVIPNNLCAGSKVQIVDMESGHGMGQVPCELTADGECRESVSVVCKNNPIYCLPEKPVGGRCNYNLDEPHSHYCRMHDKDYEGCENTPGCMTVGTKEVEGGRVPYRAFTTITNWRAGGLDAPCPPPRAVII